MYTKVNDIGEIIKLEEVPANCSTSGQVRKKLLLNALSNNDTNKVDMKLLQKVCFAGLDDLTRYRSLTWKLLLGYMSEDKDTWVDKLNKDRELYFKDFIDIYFCEDAQVDYQLLEQVSNDCVRVRPGMGFFSGKNSSRVVAQSGKKINNSVKKVLNNSTISEYTQFYSSGSDDGLENHWQIMSRILYIYAKLNPSIKYIQGMNEILAPIYYIMCDNNKNDEYAEPDAFYTFSMLMGEIQSSFLNLLEDKYNNHDMVRQYEVTLKSIRPKLFKLLNTKGVKVEYYCFRWLTLLFSQEFRLPDVLSLWDMLFADPQRFDCAVHVAVSMTILLEETIVKEDFTKILEALLHFPSEKYGIDAVLGKLRSIYCPGWKA